MSVNTFPPQHVLWNEDIGEWQLHYVAYTGNNMRQRTPTPPPQAFEQFVSCIVAVFETIAQGVLLKLLVLFV